MASGRGGSQAAGTAAAPLKYVPQEYQEILDTLELVAAQREEMLNHLLDFMKGYMEDVSEAQKTL